MVSPAVPPAPTSSLPPLRPLESLTEEGIFTALQNLYSLYCPLSPTLRFLQTHSAAGKGAPGVASPPVVDSGYASGIDDDEAEDISKTAAQIEEEIAELRVDSYERNFSTRWLTTFIARAEEISAFSSEEARENALEKAARVLSSLSSSQDEDDEDDDEEDPGFMRHFSFPLSDPSAPQDAHIEVQLHDAAQSKTDHTDVGLQSWGGSMVFSKLICAEPSCFDLSRQKLGSKPRIVELGAGTGLVSLVIAKLLPIVGVEEPTVVATDYHPTVLENLQANVTACFPQRTSPAVETCCLDWSAPSLDPPLDAPVDVLIATDCIYAPEHATWLRDLAGCLLAPGGVFWLFAAVRRAGKFTGIIDTVKTALADEEQCPKNKDGKVLKIVSESFLERVQGLGHGDENGYRMFRVEWV